MVIYTAIYGEVDKLNEPVVITDGARYVCFSDRPRVSETWEVIVSPPASSDPNRAAKFFKLHPEKLFPDNQISVWIDANFTILHDLNQLVSDALSEHNMAVFMHETRWSIYQEALNSMELRKDDPDLILTQMMKYFEQGFDDSTGLYYCGILFRRHHEPDVVKLSEIWDAEISSSTKRDQISFPVAVKQAGLDLRILLPAMRPWSVTRGFYYHGAHGRQTIGFHAKPHISTSDYHTLPLLPALMEQFIKNKWNLLKQEGVDSLVLYGAGKHTSWLLRQVEKVDGPEITGIVDDQIVEKYVIQGIPAHNTSWLLSSNEQNVCLSSDIHRKTMRARLSTLNITKRIIDLYEGLPEGPYEKFENVTTAGAATGKHENFIAEVSAPQLLSIWRTLIGYGIRRSMIWSTENHAWMVFQTMTYAGISTLAFLTDNKTSQPRFFADRPIINLNMRISDWTDVIVIPPGIPKPEHVINKITTAGISQRKIFDMTQYLNKTSTEF